MNNKLPKPNLIDPIIRKRIMKTLMPEKPDYWGPTRNSFRSFYNNIIKQNIPLVIFVIFIILFLIYRYRATKRERNEKTISDEQNVPLVATPPLGKQNADRKPDPSTDEYAKLLLQYYNQEKESAREPVIKKFSTRMDPAPGPKLAYPMYPYTKGGSLLPGGSR